MRQVNKEVKTFSPISKNLLKQIKEYFRIGLTYSSNAIEGNTLIETETKVVIEDGLICQVSRSKIITKPQGIVKLLILFTTKPKKKTLTENDILKIHRLFTIDKKTLASIGKRQS